MALKQLDNGQYVIKNRKQAAEALVMMQTLKEEIDAIRKENDLDEMEQDAVELKKAVTGFCTASKIDRLDFETDGKNFHGTLVEGHDRRWILNKQELDSLHIDTTGKVRPRSLRAILKKKLNDRDFRSVWAQITKRVVDPEGIDEIVAEGIVSFDDLAPALVEKPRTPYLRIYAD